MGDNYRKKFIIALSPEIIDKIAGEIEQYMSMNVNHEFYWEGETPILEIWSTEWYDDGYGHMRYEVWFKIILDEPEKSELRIEEMTKEEITKKCEELICADENCPLDETAENPKQCDNAYDCWYYGALLRVYEYWEDTLFGALHKALEEVGLE